MWTPLGFHVETTQFTCGYHGSHVVSHMGTMWFLCGHNMVIMWTPCGFQVDTMWFPCGHHMVSMFLCGHHHFQPLQMRSRSMETRSRLDLLLDYPHNGYLCLADLHHFQITSVAIRSRKIAKLWKPVTSLLMVRFSICKRFWQALGLFYQLFLCCFPVNGNDHVISLLAKSHCKVTWQP